MPEVTVEQQSIQAEAAAAGQAEFQAQIDEGVDVESALEAGITAAATAGGTAACVSVIGPASPLCGMAAGFAADWVMNNFVPAIQSLTRGGFDVEAAKAALYNDPYDPWDEDISRAFTEAFNSTVRSLVEYATSIGVEGYTPEVAFQRLINAGTPIRIYKPVYSPIVLPDFRASTLIEQKNRLGLTGDYYEQAGQYVEWWSQKLNEAAAKESISLAAIDATNYSFTRAGELVMPITLLSESQRSIGDDIRLMLFKAIQEEKETWTKERIIDEVYSIAGGRDDAAFYEWGMAALPPYGWSGQDDVRLILSAVRGYVADRYVRRPPTLRTAEPTELEQLAQLSPAELAELQEYQAAQLRELAALSPEEQAQLRAYSEAAAPPAPDRAQGILVSPEGIVFGNWFAAPVGRSGIVVSPQGIAHNLWQEE